MKRAAFTSATVLCCLALSTALFAQTSKATAKTTPTSATKKDAAPAVATAPAPPTPEVLKARMKPPVKGTAFVEYIQGPSKPVKDEIVTSIKVRNTSNAPIIGFRIDQYFYKGKEEVSAGTGRVRNPIAPGEIIDLTVNAPMKTGITGSQMRFSHANGAVKPEAVKKFSEPKK
jgi:hypothetical protein